VIGDESLPRDGHVVALTCDPTARREVARGGVRLARSGTRTQTQGGGGGDRSWSRGQSRRRGRRRISGRWRRHPELGVGLSGGAAATRDRGGWDGTQAQRRLAVWRSGEATGAGMEGRRWSCSSSGGGRRSEGKLVGTEVVAWRSSSGGAVARRTKGVTRSP
jgi:hypothetical protein